MSIFDEIDLDRAVNEHLANEALNSSTDAPPDLRTPAEAFTDFMQSLDKPNPSDWTTQP